jgi:hypothetical protein
MDMDTFFSETNIASLRHLALTGITATDRAALFRVLSGRFINAQNLAKHRTRAFARRQSQSDKCSSVLGQGRREAPNGKPSQLHAKLDRRQFRLPGA